MHLYVFQKLIVKIDQTIDLYGPCQFRALCLLLLKINRIQIHACDFAGPLPHCLRCLPGGQTNSPYPRHLNRIALL